ncbi:pentatricopeptide repeat-containing protein-like [Dorcoceras hygrometricum]|uniref:Pentatricopeptide repeat-containing protein-like n=1 Tax=Dorcoceras hygrometricum TaxID=472368 RepID=A0A2Z7CIH3_9LAMI|nr:pentatricopeptide repeat-containing protein-like [Dorcoceras hygrometricum]
MKEFGQKAAQSRHSHQIRSEREKTRREDQLRAKSDVKRRSAQSWIICEEKISSELDKLRRPKSDLRSTEAKQRNQI